MKTFKGKGVYGAIAIGKISVFQRGDTFVGKRHVDDVEGEKARFAAAKEKVIICADDLSPSETILLDKKQVLAFVTAFGSSQSYAAILARELHIPAVMGVGEEFLKSIQNGELAVVDGYTGEIFVEPGENTRARLEKKKVDDEDGKRLLLDQMGKKTITMDGTRISICANIGSVEQLASVFAGW